MIRQKMIFTQNLQIHQSAIFLYVKFKLHKCIQKRSHFVCVFVTLVILLMNEQMISQVISHLAEKILAIQQEIFNKLCNKYETFLYTQLVEFEGKFFFFFEDKCILFLICDVLLANQLNKKVHSKCKKMQTIFKLKTYTLAVSQSIKTHEET